MTRVRLTESGPEFSRVAFGTWRLPADDAACTPQGLRERLRVCLDHGITTIDTAEVYGGYRVEEWLGAALKLDAGLKSKVEIVTKAGIYIPCDFHPERKIAYYDSSAERLVKSAEKSLRLLGVEALDLFLVHRPDWLTRAEDTAAGLTHLLESGKIRCAGVSNYSPSQFSTLQRFMDRPLVTNQVEFSPFHMAPASDGTFDQCQERGILPMAWSALGGGRLFGDSPASVRLRATMAALGPAYGGAPIDQLCYAWIMAHPARPMIITGTSKPERLRSAAASDRLTLSRVAWYAITEAARGRRIP